MRICIIGDGRSTHTLRWAHYFALDHEVHLISYDPVEEAVPGITEHIVSSRFSSIPLSFLPRHLKIRRLIKRIDPDIVHAQFITKFGFHLPLKSGIPSVVSAWGDDILVLPPKSRSIRYLTKRALQNVDLIYAVSDHLHNRIVSEYGVSPEKVKVLPFGVDTNRFTPEKCPEFPPEETVTVFSNRGFDPVYDMETLVRGFSRAYGKDSRLRLILKGEGSEKERAMDLVSRLGLSRVVTFLPRTPYALVPYDYQHADIFVSTALSDGSPVSLLEAMSSGLSCVGTNVGGVPEWLRDGKNGLVIPPGDSVSLGEALLKLAGDPDMRSRLGREARRTILERGDWNCLMKRAENDYRMLAQSYRRKI